ncbi:MAG: DMT family transporter [Chloroflexota bacterium]|nr:DMT family transporter [Chloroflexota bacterium]
MESFYQFAALISAATWATSGAFLKTMNFKKYFTFPFYEGVISLFIVGFIILILQEWQPIINENFSNIIFFTIASTVSCIGTVFYVISIKQNPIGITFTICAVSTILMSLFLDLLLNGVKYNLWVFIGALIVLMSIFIINSKSFRDQKNKNLFGVIGGLVAGSMWGIAVFFNDRALIESGILTGAIIRAIITIFLLGIFSQIINQKIEGTKDKKEITKIIIAGSLITFSSLLWFLSLNTISGSLTSIFGNTAPVFAIIVGFFFLNEKIDKFEILGIIFAFLGIATIVIGKG